jgi:hypothetical protein
MGALICVAVFSPFATAASVNYTIAFSLTSGSVPAPSPGTFSYDADAAIGSQFSGFFVTWDGIFYDLTAEANAPVSAGTDCGTNSADFFQLLSTGSTCSTQGANEPQWFGNAYAGQNYNLFEFGDKNSAGTSSLLVEAYHVGRVGGANASYGTWTIDVVPAPEPGTLIMLLTGGALLVAGKMRFSKAAIPVKQ